MSGQPSDQPDLRGGEGRLSQDIVEMPDKRSPRYESNGRSQNKRLLRVGIDKIVRTSMHENVSHKPEHAGNEWDSSQQAPVPPYRPEIFCPSRYRRTNADRIQMLAQGPLLEE